MVDPARERLGELAAQARSTEDLVRSVIGQVFTAELAESNDFARRVTDYVAVVTRDGVRAAARAAASSRTSRPQASPAA
jgi:fructuronate reductase